MPQTFELVHPFRCLLQCRLAPASDKLTGGNQHIVIMNLHRHGDLGNVFLQV